MRAKVTRNCTRPDEPERQPNHRLSEILGDPRDIRVAPNLLDENSGRTIVAKRKRHKTSVRREIRSSSLDALLAESRFLREQMADDLAREAHAVRRMSKRANRNRTPDPDERNA
jgi:hypothetical protein